MFLAHSQYYSFFLVCLGGAMGTGCRYLISLGLPLMLGRAFPYGTLSVNVLGSFFTGVLMYVGLHTAWLSPEMRLALTTGFLGGFTTYSTFNYETVELFGHGAWMIGGLNVFLTLGLSFLAGLLGLALGQWLVGRVS